MTDWNQVPEHYFSSFVVLMTVVGNAVCTHCTHQTPIGFCLFQIWNLKIVNVTAMTFDLYNFHSHQTIQWSPSYPVWRHLLLLHFSNHWQLLICHSSVHLYLSLLFMFWTYRDILQSLSSTLLPLMGRKWHLELGFVYMNNCIYKNMANKPFSFMLDIRKSCRCLH